MVTLQLVGIDYASLPSSQSVLTLAENTVAPITLEVSTVRDLAAKTTSATKTLVVMGDKQSNRVLGHLFDVNIEFGLFNRKARTPVIMLEDGVPVLTGFMRLLAVNKSSESNNTWDQVVSYEVSVKDETGSFYDAMGDDELTDLNFSDFNHVFSAAEILDKVNNVWQDGYKYTWNMHDGGLPTYKLQEFQMAIFAKTYWDRIFAAHGKTYTWDSLTDDNNRFDKLLIPYCNGKAKMDSEDINTNSVIARRLSFDMTEVMSAPGQNSSFTNVLTNMTEIKDNGGHYDPTPNHFTNPFFLDQPDDPLLVTFTISYRIVLVNNEANDVVMIGFLGANAPSYRATTQFRMNGSNVGQVIVIGPNVTLPIGEVLTPGDNTISTVSGYTKQVSLPIAGTSGIVPVVGDVLQNRIGVGTDFNTSGVYWFNPSNPGVGANVKMKLEVDSIQVQYSPGMTSIPYNSIIRANKFVPQKIKQRDFVRGIMNLLNLYMESDANDQNNIIIKNRDEFYDDGSDVRWTGTEPEDNKLCLDMPSKIRFAVELSAKRQVFSYKPGKDPINLGYQSNVGQTYGEVRYEFDDDNMKGDKRVEILFEAAPILLSKWGMYTTSVDGTNPATGIRILYDGGAYSSELPYTIQDYPGQVTATTLYGYAGHFDNPVEPTFDLNFGVCDYYFYNTLKLFTPNNMFNMNWRRTLGQINDGNLLTAFFDLNVRDMNTIRLNDKIYVKDSWWNIQRIIDYDAQSKRPTQVELITIDRDQEFAKYRVNRPKPPLEERTPPVYQPAVPNPGTKPVSTGVQEMLRARQENKNTYADSSTNRAYGENNYFGEGSRNSYAIGSDNAVNGSESVVIGSNIKVDADGVFLVKTYNMISGGIDEVLDPFDASGTINLYSGSIDEVRNLGSNTTMNKISGGVDEVI